MKYIVTRARVGKNLAYEFPLIFPNSVVHANMRNAAMEICNMQNWIFEEIVSAGEVYVSASNCGGYSDTLERGSRGNEDARLINMSDLGGGFS